MILKKCYIFGAAEGLPEKFEKSSQDLVIAADGGLLHLRRLGVEPDITVGDFDSLGFVPTEGKIIKHPIRKDDTDTLLAVKIGLEQGFKSFVLYGCTGNRLDHTLANIQTLSHIAENGGMGLLCGNGFTAAVIKDSSVCFSSEASGTVSVFSLCEASYGVSLKGLSYPLENAKLTSSNPLGVSNEFIGKASTVTVKNGMLLIVWQCEPNIISNF